MIQKTVKAGIFSLVWIDVGLVAAVRGPQVALAVAIRVYQAWAVFPWGLDSSTTQFFWMWRMLVVAFLLGVGIFTVLCAVVVGLGSLALYIWYLLIIHQVRHAVGRYLRKN